MKRIAHIIEWDKFTDGYIKFMRYSFPEMEHFFFVTKGDFPLEGIDGKHIIQMENWDRLLTDQSCRRCLAEADKIIISCVIGNIRKECVFLYIAGSSWRKKTYLHFWGHDFYRFRKPTRTLRRWFEQRVNYVLFRRVAGLVFLIEGEYEEFRKITGISNRNFVAPMRGDPQNQLDFKEYRGRREVQDQVNIIVGNSAADTNHHEEVFRMLIPFAGKGMKVYCPLSYGNAETYVNQVLDKGKELFGENFVPLMSFMEKREYARLLSTMDIGIFYNDRQQAMGNILNLLAMGKKLYLRPGTPHWEKYRKEGYILYSADEIPRESWEEFISFPEQARWNNEELYDNTDRFKIACRQWRAVFDDRA